MTVISGRSEKCWDCFFLKVSKVIEKFNPLVARGTTWRLLAEMLQLPIGNLSRVTNLVESSVNENTASPKVCHVTADILSWLQFSLFLLDFYRRFFTFFMTKYGEYLSREACTAWWIAESTRCWHWQWIMLQYFVVMSELWKTFCRKTMHFSSIFV